MLVSSWCRAVFDGKLLCNRGLWLSQLLYDGWLCQCAVCHCNSSKQMLGSEVLRHLTVLRVGTGAVNPAWIWTSLRAKARTANWALSEQIVLSSGAVTSDVSITLLFDRCTLKKIEVTGLQLRQPHCDLDESTVCGIEGKAAVWMESDGDAHSVWISPVSLPSD